MNMSELVMKFKFIDEQVTKESKVMQKLAALDIPHLCCFIFVDKKYQNDIAEDDIIKSQLDISNDEECIFETRLIDLNTSVQVIASIFKCKEKLCKSADDNVKLFVFTNEKSRSKLDDLVQNIINDSSKILESARIGKSDLLTFFKSLNVWSPGGEYENQILDENIFHHYLLTRNSQMVNCLGTFGCEPILKRLIMRFDCDTIGYMANHKLISQDILEKQFPFHYISYSYTAKPNQFCKLESIFQSMSSCLSNEELVRLYRLESPDHRNLNAISYACRIQADKIFELLINTENVLKFTDNAVNYDVSNLIPDTIISHDDETNENFAVITMEPARIFGSSFQVSCLERILASSVTNESRASKLLVVKPMTYLIDQYILISKFIRCFMFLVQTIFMATFTWYNMNSVSENFTKLCSTNNSDNTTEELTFPGISTILWLFWPMFTLGFSIYQFVAVFEMLSNCDVRRSFFRSIFEFPWMDSMILVSIILWVIIVLFQKLPHSYFQLVAVIFIVGWLRAALFISFCSHWHGFVVSLQSSLSKYFVSFIFVFIFIYVGFSFALRILLAEYAASEKPLYTVAFKTLAAVFGMGNLDEIPEELEESVEKTLFLKAVIIAYCTLVAILVLAIIRQPDTELVVRVGSELFPRLKLRLLINVVWLMRWRRRRKLPIIGEPELGSVLYELHETFDIGGRILKREDGKYILRYCKGESDDDSTFDVENERMEMILKEIFKIQNNLEKLNKKSDVSRSMRLRGAMMKLTQRFHYKLITLNRFLYVY